MELSTSQGTLFAYTGARGHKDGQQAVVFIHGTGMDHTVWVLPSRYFARHGYNVMAPDLPAHGRSKGQPAPTIDAMAESVIEAMAAANVATAALVGQLHGIIGGVECGGTLPSIMHVHSP